MPQFVFAEFNLQALSQNVSALGRLHRASEDALAACPLWQGAPFAQVRIYTDGSYCSRTERAAWALCVLVCCDAQWQFAGFASDAVFTDKRFGSLGQGHVSAHVAELTAMAAAAAIVGNLPSAEFVLMPQLRPGSRQALIAHRFWRFSASVSPR